jgi:gamma-glutamylcyclotransferase (GGCT)/AIG2-like uncharacterized protein YtfP
MNGMESTELTDIAGARFVGRACIAGVLYDLGAYPGAVRSESPSDKVVGELYELSQPEAIEILDQFENYRPKDQTSLFIRDVATAKRIDTGKSVRVWTYFYNPRRSLRRAKRIVSGDYRLAKAS